MYDYKIRPLAKLIVLKSAERLMARYFMKQQRQKWPFQGKKNNRLIKYQCEVEWHLRKVVSSFAFAFIDGWCVCVGGGG